MEYADGRWLKRKFRKHEERVMARLDVIQAALAAVSADAAAEHQEVMDAIAALQTTVAGLTEQVATLTAGQVTDEELAAVQATVADVDAQVRAIYEPPSPPEA